MQKIHQTRKLFAHTQVTMCRGLGRIRGNWENTRKMKKFMLRRLGVSHDPGQKKPSLHDCIEAVFEQSDVLADDILSGLKTAISTVRGKSIHVVQNSSSKLAIEQLLESAPAFRDSFAHHLRDAIFGGDAQRLQGQALRFDDFQFLEEEQIDANIEFAMTQQEIALAVDDVLPTFDALISSLLGWMTVQAHLNPLKPETFVYALRESMAQQIPQDQSRAGVMTVAAAALGVSLRQLYKEVSDWLRAQGVEAVAPLHPTGSGASSGSSASKPAENSVTRTLLTLDKLRRLLSGELDTTPLNGNIKDFTHTVPASFEALEDMKLMEPMMRRLTERANQAAPMNMISDAGSVALPKAKRESNKGKKLGRELGEEVIRLMLENLMKDHRMLAGVRNSLKQLEPVLMALSQSDARFFSERLHPARQFMDKITNRSLAFTSEDQPGYFHFQKTLNNAIKIIVGSGGDAQSFARVLRKLEEGWQRDEQQQRQRAEEEARNLLHAEQRNLLAQRMALDFSDRIRNKKVPEIVANFLRGPWAQVIAESQLRCAEGTNDADGYLGLVDDLIWSVQLKLARRNRARLVEMVPGMLIKMRQGLALIEYPSERIPAFFDELITFHEQAFEGLRPTIGAVSDGSLPPAGADDSTDTADHSPASLGETVGIPIDEFWVSEEESRDAEFVKPSGDRYVAAEESEAIDPIAQHAWSADNLTTGSWVDLALGGVWVRAQLTWASPHKTLFMFISAGGMAHSMSRRTMDRLRGLSLIRLISDGRVVDHALDEVAQTALRNDIRKSSGHA